MLQEAGESQMSYGEMESRLDRLRALLEKIEQERCLQNNREFSELKDKVYKLVDRMELYEQPENAPDVEVPDYPRLLTECEDDYQNLILNLNREKHEIPDQKAA